MHSVARQLAIRVATSYSSSSSRGRSLSSFPKRQNLHEKALSYARLLARRLQRIENDNTDESKPQNELIEALDTIAQRKFGQEEQKEQPDIIVENASPPKAWWWRGSIEYCHGMEPRKSGELDESKLVPIERKFQAIGINSPEFVQDMVKLVEDTLGDGRESAPRKRDE